MQSMWKALHILFANASVAGEAVWRMSCSASRNVIASDETEMSHRPRMSR